MFLTKSGGLIIKPISIVLGKLLSLIYEGLCAVGIVNIGVAIIIFTIVIRLLLIPLSFQQNKSSKISSYIQPEMNKITKKYRGKKDQDSMMAQQEEIRKLQAEYGVNLGSGCLTSLLQLPIFFALYRVILNVPAYVQEIKDLYSPIADAIMKNEKVSETFVQFAKDNSTLSSITLEINNKNTVIDVLAKFQSSTWDSFKELITGNDDVITAMNDNVSKINETYSFFGGINLTTAPGFALTTALIIPVLSMIFQFLSIHATPQQESTDPQQAQTMKSMKMIMNVMPIMSFLVCVSVPAGVGLYWATGALVSFLTTVGVNFYFDHCDMEKVVEKSKNKAAKKAAERKAKGKKTLMEKMQEAAAMQQASQPQSSANTTAKTAANTNLKNYVPAGNTNNNQGKKYKAGSLASKANALQNYGNDNGGKK